jgi:hypothetical protein
MDRREFTKRSLLLGTGILTSSAKIVTANTGNEDANHYEEPPKNLPIRKFDVVVAGGGTAGAVAAIAAARQGAKTALIEVKGYTGGTVTEGGTALHSFYNLWKPFPGAEKRQVVRGIPAEIIDRLVKIGGSTGYPEMERGTDYDGVCTAIDTELYKLTTMEMLDEAGVFMMLNTLVVGAVKEGSRIKYAITESRAGREAVYAKCFIDCTGYGDLAAHAGAEYTEPNDHPVCNSVGIANVSMDKYYEYLKSHNAIGQLARGTRSGKPDQVIRVGAESVSLPDGFTEAARTIGMSMITTSVHDNYLMFIKCNFKLPVSPTDRDTVSKAELTIRKNMAKAVELFRKYVPGCENAFMARTSPKLCIRRGRRITCDYDITHEDVIEARHFDDDVFAYGFHDMAPSLQIKDGGTYGFPYGALCVKGIDNLLASGMLITSDFRAHMSTRNTVCCMGQGQASGTAAAMCAAKNYGTRELRYADLRQSLVKAGVYFES